MLTEDSRRQDPCEIITTTETPNAETAHLRIWPTFSMGRHRDDRRPHTRIRAEQSSQPIQKRQPGPQHQHRPPTQRSTLASHPRRRDRSGTHLIHHRTIRHDPRILRGRSDHRSDRRRPHRRRSTTTTPLRHRRRVHSLHDYPSARSDDPRRLRWRTMVGAVRTRWGTTPSCSDPSDLASCRCTLRHP